WAIAMIPAPPASNTALNAALRVVCKLLTSSSLHRNGRAQRHPPVFLSLLSRTARCHPGIPQFWEEGGPWRVAVAPRRRRVTRGTCSLPFGPTALTRAGPLAPYYAAALIVSSLGC